MSKKQQTVKPWQNLKEFLQTKDPDQKTSASRLGYKTAGSLHEMLAGNTQSVRWTALVALRKDYKVSLDDVLFNDKAPIPEKQDPTQKAMEEFQSLPNEVKKKVLIDFISRSKL